MKWREALGLGAVFAVLAALSLWMFPGHTFLMSDTQIYVPLFENLRDGSLLNRELILSGVHLSYTIYDEVTLGLSAALGLDFETVLLGQQYLFRWIGYWGAYWLARVCGVSVGASVLTSAVVWLGAFAFGPAVITTEYEPVPRGFAVPLVVACLGALASGWRNWAGLFLAIAFLYHAPAIWPVLLIALFFRQWRVVGAVGIAVVVLLLAAQYQRGAVAAQPFFSLLDEAQRHIQQTRAPYNWISTWPWRWWAQYLLTGGLALAALRRIGAKMPEAVKPFFLYIPIIGLLTIPASYLLLEKLGWALLPQVQPMRALLYCHLFCQWLGMITAWHETEEGRWLRAFAWVAVPLSLAMRGDLLLIPDGRWAAQAILLAALAAAIGIAMKWPRREWAWVASFCLAIFLGEGLEARGYKPLETKPLDGLASWARQKTVVNSVFLFGDLGRRLEPGIFRARAARAVYVCWKQGGQVNYFPQYASIWWERWNALLAPGHAPLNYADLRARGIDYLVLSKELPTEDLVAVYASPSYRVYRLR